MARDEVVRGSPLLERIKKEVLPYLLPFLHVLGFMLVKTVMDQSAKGGGCSLQ